MVRVIYVERKEDFANEAVSFLKEIREVLLICSVDHVRVINRYFIEGISDETYDKAKNTVFAEPQTDDFFEEFNTEAQEVIAVEYLPGQFDQRANSAEECIKFIAPDENPTVKSAKVYALYGTLSKSELQKIKNCLINKVEAREASLEIPETLKLNYQEPEDVVTLDGFTNYSKGRLERFLKDNGLAMDINDLLLCQVYFKQEDRNPTITEIKVIDTYWSDHCRHTTFNTTIRGVTFKDDVINNTFSNYLESRTKMGIRKPISLMNVATIAVKVLKDNGKLDKMVESEEINACTVDFKADIEGKEEDWVLLFKNETHNHPTEIEPFGGAATCIGGAIRDPLSGRSYVYAAMRVTGAGNPLVPASETLKGKLPQRKIVTTAANGYSSYGNQIGLTTGLVDEIYHSGYIAKRMEVGAVLGAAPASNIRRERPIAGDKVILLGGRTGRDGIGGATGSSKSHKADSLSSCGAEVQKGNAPEERKIQRLFRNPDVTKLIKRCNDFGAGGVAVAIGELADGLNITLDNVPKKYEGLDGTELAISESQERMAVVVAKEDAETFMALAANENLEAVLVADVTERPYLSMFFRGQNVVDISREFLDTNGAEKQADAVVENAENYDKEIPEEFTSGMKSLAGDLNICSKRGLAERFDSTIGGNTVLMPFGGKYQRTPIQAMVHKIPTNKQDCRTVSFMSYGFNPYISEKSPYHGAYLAVVESISKLVAEGAKYEDVYLTFQEYFEKLGSNEKAWGKALSAVLGAYRAQLEFGIGAIGGKDSMSGTFENIHVPPTLISFAVTTDDIERVISPEFKNFGNKVIILEPETGKDGLPEAESLMANFKIFQKLSDEGIVESCYTSAYGGIAEAVFKMAIGNRIGFEYNNAVSMKEIFGYSYGSLIIELNKDVHMADNMRLLGKTIKREVIIHADCQVRLVDLSNIYEDKLEPVYTCNKVKEPLQLREIIYKTKCSSEPRVNISGKPKILIPVFPGTNCEYDSAKAFECAGGDPEIFIVNNLNGDRLTKSLEQFAKKIKESQIIFIPGGFSGGDEPDGSGKFITSFFRNDAVTESVHELLNKRDGLMAGICNGFQALVKLGLLPYGEIMKLDEESPTLTFNDIGRHQSKLVRTRVCSTMSPWMKGCVVGETVMVPVSHGEGKFVANEYLLDEMIENGQILTQYVDMEGNPTTDIQYNPNGSEMAVEGITSIDGRVLGKMGHTERVGSGLYKNVTGEFDLKLFESAIEYFKKS